MRPGVDLHVCSGAIRDSEADPGRWNGDRTDGAQGCLRLGIEAFEGLREAPIPLCRDGMEQVLGSLRIRFPHLLHGCVEVSENPSDLLLEESEAAGPEPGNVLSGQRAKRRGCGTVGGLEIRRQVVRTRNQLLGGKRPIDRPCRTIRLRNHDVMKALALLVRHEGHSQGEEGDHLFPDFLDRRAGPIGHFQSGLREGNRDPFGPGNREPRSIPPPASRCESEELLEKVTPRNDEFGLKFSPAIGFERQREVGGDFEGALKRPGRLHPLQSVARRDDGTEIGQRVEDERL